ncbi:MAG: hypothetical protein HY962_03395 [Ignavibacteriae bacterium]|nr:hypothetical protein [Ignavibacteriota bacterium]
MRRYSPILLPAVCLLLALGTGCGDPFELDDLGETKPGAQYGDTSYVLQQPVWTGFNRPTDVLAGREPFLYVCDAGNNRIVMMDLAGAVIGASREIRNPVAMAQDYRLRLLVCAEFDTLVDGATVTFGAVYALDMVAASHNITRAAVTRLYFDPLAPQRRYTGIGVLADNSFYVARTGPNNSSIVDPDDAVLLFDKNGVLQPRVTWPLLNVDGTGLTAITRPTALATFPRRTSDFLFTQRGSNALFRAQWITMRTTGDVSQWESYYTPARDGAIDFLRPALFKRPEDITVDAAGNVFVVDAETDSVYRFNSSGFITQAFGGRTQFNAPEGIAVFDKTLYVADTQNNRILRFILSTDLR